MKIEKYKLQIEEVFSVLCQLSKFTIFIFQFSFCNVFPNQ